MRSDLDQLQGTWNITAFELDGEETPAPAFEGAHIVVKGSHFTSIGMGATYEGTFEIDEAKKPKAFDLLFTVGHAAGTRNLAIYTLDGDRWTLCLATRGSRRPVKFGTKPRSGLALETLQRQRAGRAIAKGTKAKPKTAPHAARSRAAASIPDGPPGPVTVLEGEWAMVSAVFNGVPMADDMVKWCTRVTRGDVTTVLAGPQVMLRARFTLDNPRRPHAIDYVNLEGAAKSKSQAGVVELSGEMLKICMAAPGKARPADLSSKRGDGRSLTTWRLARN